MAALRNRLPFSLSSLKHQPWPRSTAVALRLNLREPIEEEKTPYYSPARFYPARLGEVLNGRYQLATKLGHGASSTVWLARDLNEWRWEDEKYVTVKINASADHSEKIPAQSELDILRLLSETNQEHEGWQYVRRLLDSFAIKSNSHNDHMCLVHKPLRESLRVYQQRFVGDVIPSALLKIMLRTALHALDYMHTECRVIHTDLKPENLMIRVEAPSMLEREARSEFQNPLPQKVHPTGRIIYLARNNYGLPRTAHGVVEIMDFDRSVRGDKPNSGCIQAEVYRAPEVILDAGYSYSADIWNLGAMAWDLVEGKKLFGSVYSTKRKTYNEVGHLARITALLGPAPKGLLDRGKRTHLFYRPSGTLKCRIPVNFNFEDTVVHMHGNDKSMFLKFIKRMLKWDPEMRGTAKELLQDPWLYGYFDED